MAEISAREALSARLRSFDKRRLLRPMSAGEIADLAIQAYRHMARPILAASWLPMLGCGVSLIFVQVYLFPALFNSRHQGNPGLQFLETAIGFVILLGLCLPAFVICLAYSSGAAIRASADFINGELLGLDLSLQNSKLELGKLARTMLIVLFRSSASGLVGLGLLGLSALAASSKEPVIQGLGGLLGVLAILSAVVIIPFTLYQMGLSPIVQVLEGLDAKQSIARSRFLMKVQVKRASPGPVILTLWLIILLAWGGIWAGWSVLMMLINSDGSLMRNIGLGRYSVIGTSVLDSIPEYLVCWLLSPFWACMMTMVYFDRIIRVEGYDIRRLAEDVKLADRTTALLR